MIIKFKDFIIQEDRNGFILEEYGDKINPKDQSVSYGLKEQTYPATLDKCFVNILHKIKLNKKEEIDLVNYIEEIKKINNEFLVELKEILNNK